MPWDLILSKSDSMLAQMIFYKLTLSSFYKY
ncbi:hypothetical protein EPYR_03123 [Erwinia pyrifoliae DSM 12163]|nr:hypothetical protein EPYR_03123 [Erwinia pyrifoliae DSM 12163]